MEGRKEEFVRRETRTGGGDASSARLPMRHLVVYPTLTVGSFCNINSQWGHGHGGKAARYQTSDVMIGRLTDLIDRRLAWMAIAVINAGL